MALISTTYIVTRKSDGAEVYRYSHTEPVSWQRSADVKAAALAALG